MNYYGEDRRFAIPQSWSPVSIEFYSERGALDEIVVVTFVGKEKCITDLKMQHCRISESPFNQLVNVMIFHGMNVNVKVLNIFVFLSLVEAGSG
mgnify:CR=1 FL=1